jgi:hypothetical protein
MAENMPPLPWLSAMADPATLLSSSLSLSFVPCH